MTNWSVYLVRCKDGTLYCGISTDVLGRVHDHNLGRGAKYTKGRRPVELVAFSKPMTHGDALRLEQFIKRRRRSEKVNELLKWSEHLKSWDFPALGDRI